MLMKGMRPDQIAEERQAVGMGAFVRLRRLGGSGLPHQSPHLLLKLALQFRVENHNHLVQLQIKVLVATSQEFVKQLLDPLVFHCRDGIGGAENNRLKTPLQ